MKRIAIITARGGSKRIPRKNIREFCGKPILAYVIEAAIDSGVFDEVMVSTDDVEIVNIATSYGAKVPFMRSEKNSDDYATTNDVLKETLLNYQKLGRNFDELMCIYPTAPFITARKIKSAFEYFERNQGESLTAVVRYSYAPQRGLYVEDGILQFMYPEYATTRSQDLKAVYHDCGQFYIKKTLDVLQGRKPSRWLAYIVPETEVQDIDNESDWTLAELKYRFMKKNESGGENFE